MAKCRIDITGQKFTRLTVIEYADNARWLCLCDCGKRKTVRGGDLKTGNTRSCGCLKVKHGHVIDENASQIYTAWRHMKQRCNNPKDAVYPSYGGRGITVCNRWSVFENFLKDMGEPPTHEHSLDRIDNNGNYCPKNCRWTTRKQQQGNMRSNRNITFRGKTQCLSAWAREINIGQKTLWHRLVTLGWSVKKSLTTPIQKRRRKSFQDIV